MPELSDLRKLHAEFHKTVGGIVRCVHEHKVDEAKRLLGGDFFTTSNRTVSAIQALQAKVEGNSLQTKKVSVRNGTDDGDWEEF